MNPWDDPSTVAGFATNPPNQTLIQFARSELARATNRRALDLGCGAGRNTIPLAALGWHVLGVDRSLPMLRAAATRPHDPDIAAPVRFVLAPMHQLPVASRSSDLIVAHGLWNLARSGAEFRAAVLEAGRVARPGAALFVFTFSRNTLEARAVPEAGETFVFTSNREPHCFLTESQLIHELGAAGFMPDPSVPLRELNRRTPGMLAAAGAPVIWEGTFRRS